MNSYLIFDMGGTSVKYAFGDKEGHLKDNGSFPTPAEGLEAMLDEMRRIFDSSRERIAGIALSSPGQSIPGRGESEGSAPFHISTRFRLLSV